MSPNLKAFLDATAWSEIGPALLAKSDNGYNVCVGSTAAKPILFSSYAAHPRLRCEAQDSDAAGRYQFMGKYWLSYQRSIPLPDFSPASQDKWCVQLIRECKALDDIEAGRFEDAVFKCRSRWASFPGAGYGQRENKLIDMKRAYEAAGGKYWAAPTPTPAPPVIAAPVPAPVIATKSTSIIGSIFGALSAIFGKKGT